MDIFKKVLVLKALVKYLLLKGCLTNLYQKMLRLIGENLLLLSWVNLSFQSKFILAPNLIQMIRARFMALAQILQPQKMAHQKLMRTQKMIALKTSKFHRRNFI